jgi:putative endonuclease
LNVKKPGKKTWSMYILKCGDGTLYTGISNDIEHRIKMHKSGAASKYTRSRLPVKIVHREPCRDRVDALKKEYAIKRLTRTEKEDYIRRPWKIKP